MRYSVLQYVAEVDAFVFFHGVEMKGVFQCVAVCCSVLQCVAEANAFIFFHGVEMEGVL